VPGQNKCKNGPNTHTQITKNILILEKINVHVGVYFRENKHRHRSGIPMPAAATLQDIFPNGVRGMELSVHRV
jgi:hypothetical protein